MTTSAASPVEVRVPSVPVVLGVDVGTSSIKAACYGDDERLRGSARLATPWGLDVDGPTLLHPRRLLDAVMAAITEAISDLDGVEVRALGIGGMGETGLLCRADADPGGPVIGWADQRGVQEARDIARILDAEKMAGWSGRRPSALLPAATLWSMRRRGLGPTRGERWMSAPEWLCAVLGGDLAAEPSLASRTGLFDIVSRTWRDDIVDLVGIRGALPEIAPAARPRGSVSTEYGVIAGASVSVAGHDHLMAAVGVGAVAHGDVFDSCGTNEAIVGSTEPATTARAAAAVATGGTMSVHVLADLAAAFAPPFKSGEVLLRVLRALVGDQRDCVGIKTLASAAAKAVPLGADVVGASDDELRALADREPKASVWRTAVDQIVELGCNRVAALEQVIGPARRIMAAGGWLDELVVKAKSQSFGIRFQAMGGNMAGTLGAARIARIGAARWAESALHQSTHERHPRSLDVSGKQGLAMRPGGGLVVERAGQEASAQDAQEPARQPPLCVVALDAAPPRHPCRPHPDAGHQLVQLCHPSYILGQRRLCQHLPGLVHHLHVVIVISPVTSANSRTGTPVSNVETPQQPAGETSAT